MAIYLQVPKIAGDVTAAGHENWIELASVNVHVHRNIKMETGKMKDRSRSLPIFNEIEITKKTDKASPLLFGEACAGNAIPTVEIDHCTTGDNISTFQKYILSDVIISSYSEVSDDEHQHPVEYLTLNYSKIEKKYIPYNEQHQPQSPIPSGYDLIKAEKV